MSSVMESPLGKKSTYIAEYQPDLLFPIARALQREQIHVPSVLPFQGVDIWNGFEISWLNAKGKPVVVIGEFIFQAESPCLVESKSFKLYLNSFNNTIFHSIDEAKSAMERDLTKASSLPVAVTLTPITQFAPLTTGRFSGINLDEQDIVCDKYEVHSDYLTTEKIKVSEVLFSDLLKSNCLVTGQPDWASIQIEYTGNKIQHAGLLQYLVSYRNHNEFHEQCVERIFMDIMKHCAPEKLTVEAHYTRRGGLDINPFRTNDASKKPQKMRLCRQ